MKHIISLSLALLLFVSCDTITNNYIIKGQVEPGTDIGDTLYLVTMENQSPILLGKSPVEKGSFIFEGFQKEPRFCSILSFANGKIARNIDLFIEEGDINVTVAGKRSIISGGNLNSRLQEFCDSVDIVDDLRNIYIEKRNRKEVSSAALNEAYNAIHTTLMLRNRYVKEFIEKNIDNPVSVYILVNNYSAMLPETGLDIISRMPVEVQNDPSVSAVTAIYRNQMYSAVGNRFVDFDMRGLDGKQVLLSQYAGKGTPLVLSFWSSSSPSSVDEQVTLSRIASEHSDKILFASISLDTDEQHWKSAVAEKNLSGIQLTDLRGWRSSPVTLYGIDIIPFYVVLDSNGTIVMRTSDISHVLQKIQNI